jgi:hypothetical protein
MVDATMDDSSFLLGFLSIYFCLWILYWNTRGAASFDFSALTKINKGYYAVYCTAKDQW